MFVYVRMHVCMYLNMFVCVFVFMLFYCLVGSKAHKNLSGIWPIRFLNYIYVLPVIMSGRLKIKLVWLIWFAHTYTCTHITRIDMVNTSMSKRQPPPPHEKCQLKATHGSSLKDEETITLQDRQQLAPTQHFKHYIISWALAINFKVC